MHLGCVAAVVGLDHAERAAMRPFDALQSRQRGRHAGMVDVDAFFAGANSGAAAKLVSQAMPLLLEIEPQGLKAKPVLVRRYSQRLQRRAARTPDAVDEGQRIGVDLVRAGKAQALAVESEAAQALGTAQLAVVDRVERLDELGFPQQRAELARRAL